MMMKFPSIEQYRNAIKNLRFYKRTEVPYIGTVKIHGTNSGIVFKPTGEIMFQSRNRIISPGDDNLGFATAMTNIGEDVLRELEIKIRSSSSCKGKIVVFGEWAGQGIQKGVAVSEVEKFFSIFAVWVEDDIRGSDYHWMPFRTLRTLSIPEYRIFNVHQFGEWEEIVDVNRPEEAQNRFVEYTNEVEKECPVGKFFGVTGIGEGIVWVPKNDRDRDIGASFKVKGEKHQVSKVKKLAPVDVEKLNSIREFVDTVVTENRLNQGLEFLREMNLDDSDMRNMGKFLKWVANDIFKEESDTMEANGFEKKDLGKEIANSAKSWFINRIS